MTQVVLIEGGVVLQAWRDVSSLVEMAEKYGVTPNHFEAPDEVQPGWMWNGADFAPPSPAVDPAAISARRDQAIASGIVTVGDAPILTDDTTQQRLTAVALAVTLDPAATIRWKCADGHFRVLDAGQIIAAAQAVRAYVQACYDREAELLAALDAGEPVDVDAGWPFAANAPASRLTQPSIANLSQPGATVARPGDVLSITPSLFSGTPTPGLLYTATLDGADVRTALVAAGAGFTFTVPGDLAEPAVFAWTDSAGNVAGETAEVTVTVDVQVGTITATREASITAALDGVLAQDAVDSRTLHAPD